MTKKLDPNRKIRVFFSLSPKEARKIIAILRSQSLWERVYATEDLPRVSFLTNKFREALKRK